MNRIIYTNTQHEFADPGVVFPFDLAKYLATPVSCSTFYPEHQKRVYVMDYAKRRAARIALLQKKIDFWAGVFAKTGLRTTTTELTRVSQFEQRSVSKSLMNIAERTNYVKRIKPTKQDIIDFNIPYNNRQGCYMWEWNPNGRLDAQGLLDYED